MIRSISRHGITWTFDSAYPAGQFLNGDWWVVGPVSIVAIDPEPQANVTRLGADGAEHYCSRDSDCLQFLPTPYRGIYRYLHSCVRFDASYATKCEYAVIRNGNAVNPMFVEGQSYDNRYGRRSSLPAVPSVTEPLRISSPASLISVSSNPEIIEAPCTGQNGLSWPGYFDSCTWSLLRDGAVLTILMSPPPQEAFRPAYAGSDKRIRFTRRSIRLDALESLPKPSGTPALSRVERAFERVWIDHIPGWGSEYYKPAYNSPSYPAGLAQEAGYAGLLLNLDFSAQEKEKALIGFLQLAIDNIGLVRAGGSWTGEGGHMQGRKLPIVFAAKVLDDSAWFQLDPSVRFGEDSQVYYVAQNMLCEGNGYTTADVGLPDWNSRPDNPYIVCNGQKDWFGSGYRRCCTASYRNGIFLTAHIMGLKGAWNHNASFDYQDRYNEIETSLSPGSTYVSFEGSMWNAYRANYGCVWKRYNPADLYSHGYYDCGGQELKCTWQNFSCDTCREIRECADYRSEREFSYDPCGVC